MGVFSRRKPAGQETRSRWGHTFVWTPLHQTPEQLHARRATYDKLADAAIGPLLKLREGSSPGRELYTTLEKEYSADPVLEELWKQAQSVPDWVDWDQISRAQDVFYRYGPGMLNGMAYHALLGGMGANRIVEVLARTGGFSKGMARRRMFETVQYLLKCTESVASLKPGGAGHVASVKVRLVHASVRKRILKLAAENPKYYDLAANGMPINDLDTIMTALSLSGLLVWISLPRQGLFLTAQEEADYIALWRLLAHYLGSPTDVFETPQRSRAFLESFLISEFNPGELSRVLASNIVASMADQPPSYPSADHILATARWLSGDELADVLGLPPPSLKARVLFLLQCGVTNGWCYFHRALPWLERAYLDRVRHVFYSITADRALGIGGDAKFDFTHVFNLRTLVDAGKGEPGRQPGSAGGVGMRNMCVLLALLALLGVSLAGGGWLAFVVVAKVVQALYLVSWH